MLHMQVETTETKILDICMRLFVIHEFEKHALTFDLVLHS
jgi:hypothetical protein